MVSWAFPPAGGSGVQRSAKFAKYLGSWGWEPVIWAADRIGDLPSDESLLADLPAALKIFRGSNPDPLNRIREVVSRQGDNGKGKFGRFYHDKIRWRIEQLVGYLRKSMIPDPGILWALKSYGKCKKIIERENIDVIWSTFSPPSNHLLAWMLKKTTGLPWVADFRDLWTRDWCYPDHGRIRRWIDRRFERKFLDSADAVIAVTDGQTEIFRNDMPGNEGKVYTITNGVDTDDLDGLNDDNSRDKLHGPPDRFVLSYVGWFITNRLGEGFLEGLSRFTKWVDERNEGEFEFRIVGQVSSDVLDTFNRHGVAVKATGYLSHNDSLRHMMASDMLLLMACPGEIGGTCVGGKAYEYLASGRPIFLPASTDKGDMVELVKSCNAGISIISSEESVFKSLKELWNRWREGKLPSGCSKEKLEPMTRKNLAGRLASILDAVKADCSFIGQAGRQSAHTCI